MSLDVIVKVCAVVGAALGVFNYAKAWLKERREAWVGANQHLVKAVHRVDKSNQAFHIDELYLINSDAVPVSRVTVDFFPGKADEEKPVRHSVGSLGSKDEFCVERGKGKGRYCLARFTYTDAKGRVHEYAEQVYSQQK